MNMLITRPKILLIDDDELLAELLVELFMLEQLELQGVHTGDEGLACALNASFDLILLDVMLPNMNGMEVLKRIRQAENYTPILMLTARGDEMDKVLGLELGADDYLAKPYSDRELIARVKAMLRRHTQWKEQDEQAASLEAISIGDLVLKPAMQQAYYAGNVLALTGAEYRVLEVLARHRGALVSKDQISDQAFGRKLAKFDRNIDMHVSNLRKKLPPKITTVDAVPSAAETEWIKTIRGQGYLFLADV